MKPTAHADEIKEFLQESDPFDGHVITIQVMAVTDVSPAHQHTVRTTLKCSQNMMGRYGSGAHHTDGAHIGWVLEAADPCEVGCAIRTPVTKKCQYFGLENFRFHVLSRFGSHQAARIDLIWAYICL